ncbi:MAG: hypothetical protein AB3N64_11130 [Puniceicoccaceae bacterium]
MHSSISNSEPPKWPETYWKRPIPEAHWRGVGLLTALLVLGFMIFWETYWRLEGYEPQLEETAELWARLRGQAATGSADEVVYTGSSRIAFDFDQDVWQQYFGGPRPIALPKIGTNPRPFLADMANDPGFRGLLIVGVTEGLFFSPDEAPPAGEARIYLEHRENRSISARTDYLLSIPVQSAFASINKEDLSLAALIRSRWLDLPDRQGAYLMPDYPPFIGAIGPDRRIKMWHKCERDPELQRKVQQIWMPWFQLGPPLGGPPLEAIFDSVRQDVEKIRSRGGEVVFLRLPSTGELRKVEKERWPRQVYWDRLLRETGAPGIHFEDYDGLKGFDCPEWSHLSRVDAVIYTRNLVPIMQAALSR